MKTIIRKVLALILCLYVICSLFQGGAIAETTEWECPNCKKTATGNYCAICGTKAPSEPTYINGDWLLNLTVSNDQNFILAKYDIDIYLDGIHLKTISHGETFQTTVKVSNGIHKIHFASKNDMAVNGTSLFRVSGPDGHYQCTIRSRCQSIAIHDETMSGRTIDHDSIDREVFISECKSASYEKYLRYPALYTGSKIKLTGKVVSIYASPISGNFVELSEGHGNTWIVRFRNKTGVARVLAGDTVDFYGEYKGVTADSLLYSSCLSNGILPIVEASYYTIH